MPCNKNMLMVCARDARPLVRRLWPLLLLRGSRRESSNLRRTGQSQCRARSARDAHAVYLNLSLVCALRARSRRRRCGYGRRTVFRIALEKMKRASKCRQVVSGCCTAHRTGTTGIQVCSSSPLCTKISQWYFELLKSYKWFNYDANFTAPDFT